MEHIEEFHQAPPKIIRDEHYKKYRMIFPSLGARRDKMRSKASIERQRRRRRGSARSSNVINVDDSEESDLDSESTSDWRPSSESEDDHVEEERVTRYCCCHCSMRTHDFDRFRKHVAKHSRSTEELQCPTCVYRTRDAYKFHQHIRRHPSEHFCGYCNFSSMQESFVQLHVRRVHPKKPVQIHIRSQTITAAADSNGGRTMNTSSVPAANFNVKVVLQDFLALDTVEFEGILKKNVIHTLDLENIILEEDKLLSVL